MVETLPRSRSFAAAPELAPPAWRKAALAYGVAILAIAVGLAAELALADVLHGQGSYLFFVPAILIASAFGGWGRDSLPPRSAWSLNCLSSEISARCLPLTG